jgi:phosphoribosyl isomerase A
MANRLLELFPAVDIRAGRVVRLVRGEPGHETAYGDPLAAALRWQHAGADWLHVVDLDAAFGTGENLAQVAEIVGAVHGRVQVSGGVREDRSLETVLAIGCARVVIGTAALERPDWIAAVIAKQGDRIAVSIDVSDGELRSRGWTRPGGDLYTTLARLDSEGCARYVVTDIARDGTLRGPNLALLRSVCQATKSQVVAAGGISGPQDIQAIAALGLGNLEGVVLGKALYSGALTFQQALTAATSADLETQ